MSRHTTSALVPLNLPRPLPVTTDDTGTPAAVHLDGRAVTVTEVLDCWRIDDEWWRAAISRRYHHLLLADGRRLTVFQDLIAGGWYAQRYGNGMLRTALPAASARRAAGRRTLDRAQQVDAG
jgi:hypothetical protein